MTKKIEADIVVIGGGMAGCAVALKTAAKGMSTVLVEAGFLGGTCLNSGCIPTKYLLGATAHLHRPEQAWHTYETKSSINLRKLQENRIQYVETSRSHLTQTLEQHRVTILRGRGSFSGPTTLLVKTQNDEIALNFKKCVVATGSAPFSLPHLKPDGAAVIGSSTAINLTTPPKSMILVGGGAICLELGCFFHRLGTKITLVDRVDALCPSEEPEIGQVIQNFYHNLGWEFLFNKNIESVITQNNQAVLTFDDRSTLVAEKALVAIGRKPGALNLNLDAAGIKQTPKGFLDTGKYLDCTENIYAIGDCNGQVLLANAAMDQAEYIGNLLTGTINQPYIPATLPMCVYGTMEFLRAGETKYSLQNKGFQVNITKSYFNDNHLAQSLGYPEGFVQAVWVDGKLMGLSAVGHGSSHLGSIAAMLVHKGVQKNHDLGIAIAIPSLDETLKNVIVSVTE